MIAKTRERESSKFIKIISMYVKWAIEIDSALVLQ